MGYKKMSENISFADLALASSLEHNRSLKNMERMGKVVDWSRVETILMSHYTIGTSSEGVDVYQLGKPPMKKNVIKKYQRYVIL